MRLDDGAIEVTGGCRGGGIRKHHRFPRFRRQRRQRHLALQLPADGAYRVSVSCWWPERSGSSTVLVDESNTRPYTVRAGSKSQTWTLQKAATVDLGAGAHTIRVFSRSRGLRIQSVELRRP